MDAKSADVKVQLCNEFVGRTGVTLSGKYISISHTMICTLFAFRIYVKGRKTKYNFFVYTRVTYEKHIHHFHSSLSCGKIVGDEDDLFNTNYIISSF